MLEMYFNFYIVTIPKFIFNKITIIIRNHNNRNVNVLT